MKAPLKWLKKYVDIDCPVEEFASRMIMAGFEVEEIQRQDQGMEKVVVGKITELAKHPDADRLQVCQLDVGQDKTLQIVTGADNVFVGALVPVALVGSDLPCGLSIKASKLRGVPSNGMLCSGEELCLSEDAYPGAGIHGILILQEEVAPGTPIAKALGLDDVVIDFKTTANRADCFSVFGLAREAAAVLNKPLKEPDRTFHEEGGQLNDLLSVMVKDPELCPRYMARVVKDVRIAPSPVWMQKELQACGVRPINNIVDITNYVMLEMGQPMHAFDLRQVEGSTIVVRRAMEGEKIVTLDEKERTLDASMLVIADAKKPSAVAGVMGGEHSGVQEDTSTVVFESAIFHWSSIRLTAKALGMRSESSARFEKGLPLYLSEQAMERAMALIQQLGCGKPVKGCVDILNGKMEPVRIKVSAARVNGHLGQNIPAETMKELLTRLGFSVEIQGEELNIVVPSWRKDVEAYADIAEEVQRMYGYHTIPSIPPPAEAARGGRPYNQHQALALKEVLKGLGLYEAVHYSFMAPSDLDKLRLNPEDTLRNTVRILNTLGEDYSLMRTTLFPAMLRSLAMNLNRKAQKVRLFEISRVFLPVAEAPLPDEQEQLCIGIVEEGMDFFAIKGMLDTICAQMRLGKGVYVREANPSWHPGRSARLMLDGKPLAVVGEVHPDVAEAYGISRRIYAIQLNVSYMFEKVSRDFSIRPLPKYPAITRDISMVLDRDVPAGDVLEAIAKAGGELLESAELFDVYEGEQVGKEKKSMAYSLVFRAQDRTLVDEEASSCFARITRALERKLGAQLRQ